jgi:glycosyltransferase involved in cell wall biosynthesis
MRQIRRLVRERKVDIIHANEPHALSAAWLARAHRSVTLIASRRIALPLSRSFISLARYKAAARVVAVSQFVEKSVIESGLPPSRIEVIYDGVEMPAAISRADRESARAQFAIPNEGPCIGNVGAFVPEKGQALLLRALAKVRTKPGTQFSGCRAPSSHTWRNWRASSKFSTW